MATNVDDVKSGKIVVLGRYPSLHVALGCVYIERVHASIVPAHQATVYL
jgi:hypothetical protein